MTRAVRRVLAASAAAIIAVGAALLYAPLVVELLSWDRSPSLRREQVRTTFWVILPAAAIAVAAGTWIGVEIASDGRPLPGWRAAKWGGAVSTAIGLLLLLLGPAALVLTPLCGIAGSLSGGITALLFSKGTRSDRNPRHPRGVVQP